MKKLSSKCSLELVETSELSDVVSSVVYSLKRLVFDMEESHEKGVRKRHGGDAHCSYCEDIKDAKAALKAAGVRT